jgi:zinc protease
MKCALLAMATALAAFAAPLAAQDGFPPPPPIADPKPFKLPPHQTYALPNGMKVTLIQSGIAPKTVVSLRVRAGNATEGKDTWLSDLTAEMLREGAGGRSAAQLATAAAGMGGDLNVAVGTQMTAVTMNALSEHAPAAIALVSDVAMRPDLPAGELARVQANLHRRLAQALAQPGVIADVALARVIYGTDHPYGRPLPTAAQLGAYTIDSVKAFHASQFGAKRAHLYVAGRYDAASVKAAVEKVFGGWKAGPEPMRLTSPHNPGPKVVLVDRKGSPQSTLRIAFPAPQVGSESDIAARVMNELLGGAFSSRITTNIREDKGYTYSPRSGIAFNPEEALWTFVADVTTAVTGASLAEVFKEIRTLQGTAPGDEEAKGIRTYIAGVFAIQNSTSGAVVETLATRDMLGLPDEWLDRYVPAVLAITPAAMTASAKANLPLERATLVVVGDLATVEPQLKALPELSNVPFARVTVP